MQRNIIPGHGRPSQNFADTYFVTCSPGVMAAIEGCHSPRKPSAREVDPADGPLSPSGGRCV